MDARGILTKLEKTHRTWGMRIDGLGDEAFLRPARGGGWGVGQICRHIELVSEMLLRNAEQCTRGDGADMGFRIQPALLMLFGTLPPVRIKVPDLPPDLQHLGKPEPINAADGRDALERVATQMRGLHDAVAGASPRCRREHPAGGWLNALQWYAMNEMHYRHHLRQLDRLLAISSA
jgi:hypothetical protein